MKMQNRAVSTVQSDTQPLEREYELYGDMLYRLCMVMLANKADAEDAVQTTFLRLWTKSPAFESDEHERAWLIRVATNICKDLLRSSWHSKSVGLDDVAEQGEETDMTPALVLERLLTLPPKYRSALHLFYYEGYPVRKIAALLHTKDATVKVWLHRGRELLRLELEGEQEL